MNLIAAKPANEVTPDSGGPILLDQPPVAPSPITASVCEPYRESIELWLSRGRNATAIWQDLVDQHGYSGGYQTVKRFVRKLRGAHSPQAVGIILTSPGEEAQVDYGTGPMVRDEKSGKYRRTRLFVLTLGYSRKSVRLLVFRSSSQVWAELHEKAFRRLGGTPRVVVLDNLREGVLAPDIYDPTLNPLYRAVLSHYGAVAMPCRVRDPDRKGKVESGVGHAQKTPLKGQRFESLEEAQAYLDHWEQRWADTRIHGTTQRQVAAMFVEEKSFLQPLPIEPFRYYQYGERVVHLDGCVEVERAYYGLPPGWIGRAVKVPWAALHVRILDPHSPQLFRAPTMWIAPKNLRPPPFTCSPAPPRPAPTSVYSARLFTAMKRISAFAAFWGLWRWPKNTAWPLSRMPALRLSISGWRATALCVVTWSAILSSRCAMSIR